MIWLRCFCSILTATISTMGKKRKAGGRPFGHDESRREREEDGKLRINTYEDVADSEDEFHINRDKILLEEGRAQKRQRKAQEESNDHLIGIGNLWCCANPPHRCSI